MRTTIDLPDDIHAIATAIARDNRTSLSDTVAQLLRLSLKRSDDFTLTVSPRTGLPVFSTGRPVTSEDVRSLDDDE